MIFYVLYTNLVTFSPVTLDITRWQTVIFRTIAKNCLFVLNISENTGLTFTKFSELVGLQVWMINLTFILWLSKGCCYSNLLIFWGKKCTWLTPPLFLVLAFRNGLKDCNSDSKCHMAMILLHRVKIWWTYGPVIGEFTRWQIETFWMTTIQIGISLTLWRPVFIRFVLTTTTILWLFGFCPGLPNGR